MIKREVTSASRIDVHRISRGLIGIVIISTAAIASTALVPRSRAAQQQRQGELHANYSRQTQSKSNAWGAGTQLQLVWGAKHAPVVLGTSLGGDYLKQENGGPTSWNTSADAVVEPGGNGAVTPY